MKVFLFAVLLCCLLLATSTLAKKKHRKHEKKEEDKSTKDELDLIADDDADTVKNTVLSLDAFEEGEKPEVKPRRNKTGRRYPCANFHCGAGKQCDINDNGKPHCICIRQCPTEVDNRRRVCSNHNETWDNDCELYRMRCLCEESDENCLKKKYKHAHVDYYGACREIEPCTAEELVDFPRRMRDWLFNVMKDLAERHELSDEYVQLEKEAEASINHKWVNAVIWKFCDLDSHPNDRSVSRHELFPIRAPLIAMEHCIAPFLNSCDKDDDHQITLEEWGRCLGLEEEEIQDKCPKSFIG